MLLCSICMGFSVDLNYVLMYILFPVGIQKSFTTMTTLIRNRQLQQKQQRQQQEQQRRR